jgi:hypothetical protein
MNTNTRKLTQVLEQLQEVDVDMLTLEDMRLLESLHLSARKLLALYPLKREPLKIVNRKLVR